MRNLATSANADANANANANANIIANTNTNTATTSSARTCPKNLRRNKLNRENENVASLRLRNT